MTKRTNSLFCGDLLIGQNSLLKLPDRNGVLHPDLFTLHAVFRHPMKNSYRWFTVHICFQLKIFNATSFTIWNIRFLRPDYILQLGSREPYGLMYQYAKRGIKF